MDVKKKKRKRLLFLFSVVIKAQFKLLAFECGGFVPNVLNKGNILYDLK
jgi:hypothetical protein